MAKKAPQSTLQQITARIKGNSKVAVGIAIILLLLVILAVMVLGKEEPARTSSVAELTKSTVNKTNTAKAKAEAAAEAAASPTGQAGAASPSTTKKKTTTTASGATSGSGSGSSSSAGGSSAADAPAVTPFSVESNAYVEVDGPNDADIGCNQSHLFSFTGSITASAAGTATYFWEFSDGGSTAPQSLVFTGAGTRNVNTSWNLFSGSTPGSYEISGYAQLVVTSPNEAYSKESDGAFTIYVNCV